MRKTGLALSIQQPWAWLIVNGWKDVENRTWATNVRGVIGVHAGKKVDREGYKFVRANFRDVPLPEPHELATGGIVGRVRLIDCVEDSDSPWFFGPFGFVVSHPESLPLIPCRGKLGFFRPDILAPASTGATDE